jgi:uncharacterized membrane protein YhaH (DUF805 family)
MEVMIQVIILMRIVLITVQPFIDKRHNGWLAWMVFYFIFSELVPFMIIACQIDKKRRPKKFKEL